MEEVRHAARNYRDSGYHHPGHHSLAVPLAQSASRRSLSRERRSRWSRRSADMTRAKGDGRASGGSEESSDIASGTEYEKGEQRSNPAGRVSEKRAASSGPSGASS
jgi:hypothetical protein